jgi:hypothetical protein
MFTLDPCFACKQRFPITDINNINSCCSETAGAFAGQSSLNALIGTDAGESCKKCLAESKKALGKSSCDLRLTNSPIWTQVPHYYPELLAQYKNKQKALNVCIEQCKQLRGSHNQCMLNCQTDDAAVIQFGQSKSNHSNESFNRLSHDKGRGDNHTYEDEQDISKKRNSNFTGPVNDVVMEGFEFSKSKCWGDLCSNKAKWMAILYIVLGIIGIVIIIKLMKK